MKGKLVLGFLAVQIILACVTGCGKANNSIDGEDSAAVITSVENTTDNNFDNGNQGEVNGFDFDRAIKNITFEGERIQLPTTLNELGDDFSLDYQFEEEMSYGNITAYELLKNGKKVALVSVLTDEEKELNDKRFITFYIENEYTETKSAEIDGFRIGDEISTVRYVYGEETSYHKDARPIIFGDSYKYISNDNYIIDFKTDEDEKIIAIYITLTGKFK